MRSSQEVKLLSFALELEQEKVIAENNNKDSGNDTKYFINQD